METNFFLSSISLFNQLFFLSFSVLRLLTSHCPAEKLSRKEPAFMYNDLSQPKHQQDIRTSRVDGHEKDVFKRISNYDAATRIFSLAVTPQPSLTIFSRLPSNELLELMPLVRHCTKNQVSQNNDATTMTTEQEEEETSFRETS